MAGLGSIGKKKQNEPQKTVEAHELISSAEVENIRKALIETNADLVVMGMLDEDVRARLERIVAKDHKEVTKGNKEVIAYVVRETIGTGVIEQILKDPKITDIGYNGSELIVETNDNKFQFETEFEIDETYITRLVNKFANANDKEFTPKSPIFDGRFKNVRINAVHSDNTAPESGTTMALRVVRPKLALTEKNFEGFAPKFMLDFFRAAALTKANMVISGTTGTGKTELHKLIASNIPFDDRILLIEDTPETFMKQMFADKDVYSWVTSENVNVTKLIKAGLRNHPAWIMVTETRGDEAYEMIQAVLSGHSIITSLHATEARAIPSRFINMAKMGYELSEEALKGDILRYFHFGIHIRKVKFHGHVIRYLSEIIEFDPDAPGGGHTVFKQRFVDGVFHFETFDVSKKFREMMEEVMVEMNFPANFKSERQYDPTKDAHTFEATIPLDETGRPDYKEIKRRGTTIDILMGREKAFFNPDNADDKLDYGTNREGYIAPDLGDKNRPSDNVTSSKITQAKRNLDAQQNGQARRPGKPQRPESEGLRQTAATRDIERDATRIAQSVNQNKQTEAPVRKPQPQRNQPNRRPQQAAQVEQKTTLTPQQILEQAKKKMQYEDV